MAATRAGGSSANRFRRRSSRRELPARRRGRGARPRTGAGPPRCRRPRRRPRNHPRTGSNRFLDLHGSSGTRWSLCPSPARPCSRGSAVQLTVEACDCGRAPLAHRHGDADEEQVPQRAARALSAGVAEPWSVGIARPAGEAGSGKTAPPASVQVSHGSLRSSAGACDALFTPRPRRPPSVRGYGEFARLRRARWDHVTSALVQESSRAHVEDVHGPTRQVAPCFRAAPRPQRCRVAGARGDGDTESNNCCDRCSRAHGCGSNLSHLTGPS